MTPGALRETPLKISFFGLPASLGNEQLSRINNRLGSIVLANFQSWPVVVLELKGCYLRRLLCMLSIEYKQQLKQALRSFCSWGNKTLTSSYTVIVGLFESNTSFSLTWTEPKGCKLEMVALCFLTEIVSCDPCVFTDWFPLRGSRLYCVIGVEISPHEQIMCTHSASRNQNNDRLIDFMMTIIHRYLQVLTAFRTRRLIY